MKKIIISLFISLLLISTTYARDATDVVFDVDQFIADGAIKLFRTGCLKYYTNQSEFEFWVNRNSFKLIPTFAAVNLLKKPGGKAYSVSNRDSVNNINVDYVLAAEAENQCTVFINKVNIDIVRKSFTKFRSEFMKSNLILNTSSKTKDILGGKLKTIQYEYYKNEQWQMTLEVIESTSKKTFYPFIISAKTKRRMDNNFK